MRRIDLGIASYGKNAGQLALTVSTILATAVNELRIMIVHNPSEGDDDTRTLIHELAAGDIRIVPVWMPSNVGYAGAVNELFRRALTDYVIYCDNDVMISTRGWDERFCALMDAHPEVAQVFPGAGHYGFNNGQYHECLWNAGYCWAMRSASMQTIFWFERTVMDTLLGHHEEVDLMIRLRLAGYRIACCPDVDVKHLETATNANEADHKPGGRIHDGVVRWMNKWNRYFCGDALEYSMTKYDPRALRYTDWPPCTLYLERMTLAMFPQWNSAPRKVSVPGVGVMDAVEVLKPEGPYRGRAI